MNEINVQLSESVVTITIQRSDKKNALTRPMYKEMADALVTANDNAECRVVIIQGAAGCFTAGNDLADFVEQTGPEGLVETVEFMHALLNCNKVVIAKVEGLAVGIGTTMLLHCDLVYCSPETKFLLPFINLGLVPEYASSYLLPLVAGRRKASEWLLLGEPFGAKLAEENGVVTSVIPSEQLDAHVQRVAEKISLKPSLALRQSKALMNTANVQIKRIIDNELDIFVKALESAPAKEAFSAFFERRDVDRTIFK